MYILQSLASLLLQKEALKKSIQLRSITASSVNISYNRECLQLMHSGDCYQFSFFMTWSLLAELEELASAQHKSVLYFDCECSVHIENYVQKNPASFLNAFSIDCADCFSKNVGNAVDNSSDVFAIVIDSVTSFNYSDNFEVFLKALDVLLRFAVEREAVVVVGMCDFFCNRRDEILQVFSNNQLSLKSIKLRGFQ